jgi:hypothetical protein
MDQVSGGFGIREWTSRDSKVQCVSLAAFKIEGLLSRITKRQDILNLYVWEPNTLTMIPESHVNTSYPILNQHPLHLHHTLQIKQWVLNTMRTAQLSQSMIRAPRLLPQMRHCPMLGSPCPNFGSRVLRPRGKSGESE